MTKRTIAITGGIGAGKSVVCHAVAAMGFPVYDCDSEAKRLMAADESMKRAIADAISSAAILPDGSLDRKAIADIVFTDAEKLAKLNSIVHGAVKNDFELWRNSRKSPVVFVETAILYESGFDAIVDSIWEVTAPTEVRIDRVMRRNGIGRAEVERRIAAQRSAPLPTHRIIVNDDSTPLLPQILQLLNEES